jgi:hypothetical protein
MVRWWLFHAYTGRIGKQVVSKANCEFESKVRGCTRLTLHSRLAVLCAAVLAVVLRSGDSPAGSRMLIRRLDRAQCSALVVHNSTYAATVPPSWPKSVGMRTSVSLFHVTPSLLVLDSCSSACLLWPRWTKYRRSSTESLVPIISIAEVMESGRCSDSGFPNRQSVLRLKSAKAQHLPEKAESCKKKSIFAGKISSKVNRRTTRGTKRCDGIS